MSANLVQSRRKCGANGVNATFALDLQGGCKSWCKWHLPHLHHICYSFGPDFLTFSLRKYGVNPFFRSVNLKFHKRNDY